MPQRTEDPTQSLFDSHPLLCFERPFEASERRQPGFLAILSEMTPAERISASRHGGFSRRERSIWAARFPEEVPLVNGECEWLSLNCADLD